jgi:glycopeptide antibiotics resistance protein
MWQNLSDQVSFCLILKECGYFVTSIYKMCKNIVAVILFHYLALLAKVILFKIQFGSVTYNVYYGLLSFQQNLDRANFIPFKTIYYLLKEPIDVFVVQNIFGNIIGFAPLGFLLPMLCTSLSSFLKIGIIAFTFSLTLEVIQLVKVLGIFDVDDIILNTSGALLGYAVYKIFLRFRKHVLAS